MSKTPTLYDEDGNETELPFKWEICERCEGCATDRGASVECDGGGFTSSEWAEQDDDFKEDYIAGKYDRPCAYCNGLGRIKVPDFRKMDPETCQEYLEQEQDDRDYDAMCAAERRMGA